MASIGQTTRPGYVYDSATDTWIPIGIGPHTHASTDLSGVIANSIVDAKADLITATADNTPARLAAGNNGESLVVDSSTATGLRWQPIETRNAVQNSAFDIWQRGTSISVAGGSTSTYCPDRWQGYRGNQGLTVSRQTVDSLGTTPGQRITYAARVQRNSGNADLGPLYLLQQLESADSVHYAGKTVTFSFYARAGANYSASSSLLNAAIITGTGTDQNQLTSWTNYIEISSSNTLTTSWQRFTLTTTLAINVNQLGFRFWYTPTGTAGANDWFEVTGVQLELGSVATSYRRQATSIAGELAVCYRYFQFIDGTKNWGWGNAYSSTALGRYFVPTANLRLVNPSVTLSGTPQVFDGITVTNITSITNIGTPSSAGFHMDVNVASGLTQYRAYTIYANNGSVSVSAEL